MSETSTSGSDPLRSPELVLRQPAHRVSPRAVGYWRLGAAVRLLVVLVLVVVAVATQRPPAWGVALGVLLVAAVVAHLVLMPRIRFRVHRWEVTHEAIYTRSGWLRRDVRIVPLSRVQTVSSSQSALMRAYGLASLQVTTASSAGAVIVEGLDATTAADVVAELTRDTAATTGDAT